MINSHLREREGLQEAVELIPVERLSLAASIQPFEQDAGRLIHESLQLFGIESHAIVADVTSQLGLEDFPYIGQARPVSDSTGPAIYVGQF